MMGKYYESFSEAEDAEYVLASEIPSDTTDIFFVDDEGDLVYRAWDGDGTSRFSVFPPGPEGEGWITAEKWDNDFQTKLRPMRGDSITLKFVAG